MTPSHFEVNMLVRLFGSNFRTLKSKFELSMVAADLRRQEDRDRGVIDVPIAGMEEPLRLVRTVAIYGANASGKSTVLTAARALRWLGTDSSAQTKPGAKIPPYEPFILDDESRNAPVELGCDVIFNKSILRYIIEFKGDAILRETLSLLDGRRERKLIDRLPSGEVRGSLIARNEANQLYVREMQPNVAVLSKLAQHGPSRGRGSAQPYYRAVRLATQYKDYSDSTGLHIELGGVKDERFAENAEYRDWIMRHLIKPADVGITDVITRQETFRIPNAVREQLEKLTSGVKVPDKRVAICFVHEGANPVPLEFRMESTGTIKIYNIADDWWSLAHRPVTLFADELSASLHPRLLDGVIRAVNEGTTERVQSQLVFTTHDTGLLESLDGRPPALRRDQVYFTKKDSRGVSELYSLAEFKEEARPVHNIRKRYLSGLYGAIPSVEKLAL